MILLLVVLGMARVQAGDLATGFDTANKLYAEGKFTEAVAAYGRIIQSGKASAPVYFNLGNAFFKAGQLGRAILAYQHAKELSARDPDVLANLQFARNQVQGPTLTPSAPGRWLGRLSLNEWTVLSAASTWLWLLLLTLRQWHPPLRSALRGWTAFGGVCALLLGVCLATQYYRIRMRPTAVIIVAEAPLRQAPLADSPSAGTLYDGAELRVLDRKDSWLQVSTGPRRIGWIRRDEAVAANVR